MEQFRPKIRLRGQAKVVRDSAVMDALNEGLSYAEAAHLFGLNASHVRTIKSEAMHRSNSNRTRLMRALQQAANSRGEIQGDHFKEFVNRHHIDAHEAKHILMKGLSRAGLVTYVQNNQGNASSPFKVIKLTSKGMIWQMPAEVQLEEAPEALETVPEEPEEMSKRLQEHLDGLGDVLRAEKERFGETYPLLAALRSRKEDLKGAADILDRHGFTEQALAILDSAEPKDPLEKEILAYMRFNGD